MKNYTQKPIKIDADIIKFGIASGGIKSVKNMDIFNIENVMRANLGIYNMAPEQNVTLFTANTVNSRITVVNTLRFTVAGQTIRANMRAVTFTSTGTLPAPLVAGTVYFIHDDGTSATEYRLAPTALDARNGTSLITLTTVGTGTHTVTTVLQGWFTHFAKDERTGILYAQDYNNRVWIQFTSADIWALIPGNVLTSGTGNGLAVWKDYLFAFRNTAVDVYGPLSGTPSWTNNWTGATGLTTSLHTPFESQNGRLYIINNDQLNNIPYIASLQETVSSTFNPATPSTYTWNSQALDLPDFDYINCINEQNDLLMIGTTSGKIYPWDKISDSFRTPIQGLEANVTCMLNVNNYLYFGAGNKGNIYRTLGTTVEMVVDFSDDLSGYPQSTATCVDLARYPGGILAYIRAGDTSNFNSGIYFIDIQNQHRYSLFNTFADGYQFQTFSSPVKLYSDGKGYQYYASWTGQSLYGGVDSQIFGSGPYRQTNDKTILLSELFRVSDDANNPRTFETVQIFLRKPIVPGQSVKVAFRTNEDSAFGTDIEFNSTNMAQYGGNAGVQKMNVLKTNFLQIRATVSIPTSPNGTTFQYATPEIMEVRVV